MQRPLASPTSSSPRHSKGPRLPVIKLETQKRVGHKPWVLPGCDPVEAMCPKVQGSKWWPARLGAFANGNGSRHLWG